MRTTTLLVAAHLGAVTGACQQQTVCESGATQACVCTDGRPGAQFCSRDGMGWGPCQCTGPAPQPAAAVPEPPTVPPANVPPVAIPSSEHPAAPTAEPPAQPSETAPTPSEDGTTAAGPRTPSAVLAVIRGASPAVRHCYDRGLEADPSLQGRLLLKLGIMPQGTVASASVERDDLHSPVVTGCVLSSFRRLRFPPTTTPGLQTITYPLVLDSAP